MKQHPVLQQLRQLNPGWVFRLISVYYESAARRWLLAITSPEGASTYHRFSKPDESSIREAIQDSPLGHRIVFSPPPLPLRAVKPCPVCGSELSLIRGRHPGDAKREVCPTCIVEQLEELYHRATIRPATAGLP